MTMFETLGSKCALCALEPRVELAGHKNDPKVGLEWRDVFALGWFLGRYTTDEAASYCTPHRERIEHLRKLLAKAGVVSMHSVSLLAEPPNVE